MDCAGNVTTHVQEVIVDDNEGPLFSETPQDLTALCLADVPGDQGVTATDNCGENVTVVFSQDTISMTADTSIIINSWVSADCAGNTSIHEQEIIYIPKQPAIELTKGSTLIESGDGYPLAGDTIFYDFEITNTGNVLLEDIELVDLVLEGLLCDSISLLAGNTTMCTGFYIVAQNDINTGVVCNSAIVNGVTVEGDMASDTSDSTNPADELGGDDDKTNTPLTQFDSIVLFKTISSVTDVNENGVVDLGDIVNYQFEVQNLGNTTLYDLTISDSITTVQGSLDSLVAGMIDVMTFTASYEIQPQDGTTGFVENTAVINGVTSTGLDISDVSDAGQNDLETPDGQGGIDGDPTNDPVIICVVNQIICPDDLTLPSCALQSDIDSAFTTWLSEFGGGGCGVVGIFDDTYMAPETCGGMTEVTWRLINTSNGDTIDSCIRLFEALPDDQGPICPSDWDVTISSEMDICVLPAFANVTDIGVHTGQPVIDNCSSADEISLSYTDFLIPEFCDVLGGFFEEREVERTYVFMDACGNESSCVQVITYEFDECVALDNFGSIGVNSTDEILVPPGCDLPLIEETAPTSSDCGFVEYMWLYSTEVDENGEPFNATNLNLGVIWFMIDGATDATFDPGVIDEDTYFIRCARNMSCCDFGESNIISFLIDPNASCPELIQDTENVIADCDNPVILLSPTNDISNGQMMRFLTNQEAQLSNRSSSNSALTIDARSGTTMNPGFEITVGAEYKVYLDGCPE